VPELADVAAGPAQRTASDDDPAAELAFEQVLETI
jgi:hypothetical protein